MKRRRLAPGRQFVGLPWRVCGLLMCGLFVLNACGATTGLRSARLPPAKGLSGTIMPTYTLNQIADQYIAHMTMDQEIGQLFIVTFVGTSYNADNMAMVEQMHAGAVLLFADNMTSQTQTQLMLSSAQAHATFPLLTFTDEEGGLVDRLRAFYGSRPSATEIGASGSTTFAQSQGAKAARDLRSFGFNADFAPDVDVQLVDGPDQYMRTFGTTPEAVTTMAGAYLTGLQGGGVLGCLKHFPGLGAATTDAHLDLPVINRSRSEIESVELAPYRTLIKTGQVGLVMVTDLEMPALDPNNPAEVSHAIVSGVLRQELGYDGVVTTDDLHMQGIADRYALPEAGVRAILAGVDLLLGPSNAQEMRGMVQGMQTALASGRLTKARIDDSVRRILVLKMRMGLIPVPADLVAPVAPLGSMSPQAVAGPVALKPKN